MNPISVSLFWLSLLLTIWLAVVQGSTAANKQRCAYTRGTWCTNFEAQEPVPWRPAPRGDKDCPGGCNGVGRCNHDTGLCDCPAGWVGPGCKEPFRRPCTHRQRAAGDLSVVPYSHIGLDGRDLDWTAFRERKLYSRCGGICDEDVAICYCDGPMGRVPAPPGSPPGTPPLRRGRPLVTFHHAPKTTWDGQPAFGEVAYDKVYGPQGYCNVSDPPWVPGCGMDGLGGRTCDTPVEAFCPGACSGHGSCYIGWCMCDEGYYGHDCARRKAGLPLLPSSINDRPWVKSVLGGEPPAALEPPPRPSRKRPLIYVYDLDPMFQSKIMQYRVTPRWCVHRIHGAPTNHTEWTDMWVYAADTLLHESLLISEHRTFDPEEADFFYVPHAASCLPFPIGSWADAPWFPEPGGPRVMQMVNLLRDTLSWINATFPYWRRRGGRDHVWLFTHDEGACWAPTALNASIWLTHWGRTGLNHTSNTAFIPDRYDEDFKSYRQPEGFVKFTKGHPCYNPEKDLVIPAFKRPSHYAASALHGGPTRPRDILFFFRGDVGKHRQPNYSRGVRQQIYKMAKEGGWAEKHRFLIGDSSDVEGDYSELLARSKFCLVAPGDGWSARMEDSALHGCIPVIIADGVHTVFESILDVDAFSIRMPQEMVPRLLEILLAVPEKTIRSKQSHLGRVWHRFRYASLPLLSDELRRSQRDNEERWYLKGHHRRALTQQQQGQQGQHTTAGVAANTNASRVPLPRPYEGDPGEDDAFATILQWLHSRIPYARGETASG